MYPNAINVTIDNINKYTVIYIIPLAYILMFRPNLLYIHYLTYLFIAIISGITILFYNNQYRLSKTTLLLVAILWFCSLLIAISISFNFNNANFLSLIDVFKPIFFSLILLSSYFIGRHYQKKTIIKALLVMAYIVFLFQIATGLDQLFNLQALDTIYYSDKVKSLGSLVRITGTMSNPNTFAWIITQMSIIIFLFEPKKKVRFVFVILGLILVAISGSRSAFILFPFIIFVSKALSERHNLTFYLIRLPIYLLILLGILSSSYWLLLKFGSDLKYLYQIVSILETGSLASVNSFDARLIMWNDAWNLFNRDSNLSTWLFGLGPGTISSLDNDYLYSLYNFGTIFFVLNLFFYILVFYIFSKNISLKSKAFGQQYIIYSLIVGFQAETLSGWNYPILLLFFLGITLSFGKSKLSES